MGLLVFYLSIALFISFLCSILESVVLSIPDTFVAILKEKNYKQGSKLLKLKNSIDRPLAAILSLNTIAHTVGAAGVGAQAMQIFGEAYIGVISAVLTILILVFSEIIPKTLGVIYWRSLVIPSVYVLNILIIALYPFVLVAEFLTKLITRKKEKKTLNREDLKIMMELGYKEGTFLKQESYILKNLLSFSSLKAKDILTPRPVVFSLNSEMTLKEIMEKYPALEYSRIPIFTENIDDMKYYVRKDDILQNVAEGKRDKTIFNLRRKLLTVPENISLFNLFETLLKKREYIAMTVTEFGGVSGIVTLEDLVETLIGIEIVDETDNVTDMQQYAKKRWQERSAKFKEEEADNKK